jgi:cytochrome P450
MNSDIGAAIRPDASNFVAIDLASEALRQQAFEVMAEWAVLAPFFIRMGGAVHAFCARHADVDAVLKDRVGFSTEFPTNPGAERFDKFMGVKVLAQMDGPPHDRVRRLMAPVFSRAAMSVLEEDFEAVVDALLARIEGGAFDGMIDFAAELPIRTRWDVMLGFDEEQKAVALRMHEAVPLATRLKAGETHPKEYIEAHLATRAVVDRLIAARRRAPTGDLISQLVVTHDNSDDKLSDVELFDQIFTLLAAGTQGLATGMGSALLTLCRHPDQLQTLRQRLELVPLAIEECLRIHGAGFLSFARFPIGDVEVGGTRIPDGMPTFLGLQSSSYDPAVYPDPLLFDILRNPKNSLHFGGGAHFCIGLNLSRTVLRIALTRILERFPKLRLADRAFQPVYFGQVGELRIRSLPMRYD